MSSQLKRIMSRDDIGIVTQLNDKALIHGRDFRRVFRPIYFVRMVNVLPDAMVARGGAVHDCILDEHRALNTVPVIVTQLDGKLTVCASTKSTGITRRRYEMRTVMHYLMRRWPEAVLYTSAYWMSTGRWTWRLPS